MRLARARTTPALQVAPPAVGVALTRVAPRAPPPSQRRSRTTCGSSPSGWRASTTISPARCPAAAPPAPADAPARPRPPRRRRVALCRWQITSRNEYDKTIQETEAAYSKVGGWARPRPSWARPWRAPRIRLADARGARGAVWLRAQIMESSQTLLHVLKRESVNLTKKKQTSD